MSDALNADFADLPECSCAMTEASMRTCARHGEEGWLEHTLTEYGTTDCPVEAVRANVDDGECSACGARIPPVRQRAEGGA